MATTFDAPAWLLDFAQFEWGIQKAGTQFRSPFNGTLQAADFLAERWVCAIRFPNRARVDAGAVEALLNMLAGGVNRIRIPHMASGTKQARRQPRGTMRGGPVLSASIARGAAVLPIATTPGATVKAGDMVGCNQQLYQASADATANGSGFMNLPVVNRVRAAASVGTSVIWDGPTALFVMPAMSARHAHTPAILQGGQLDLEEYF